MKRFLLMIAILSAITPLFAANDISQLSSEAQIEYLTNALSIQTADSMQSIGSGFGNLYNSGFMTSLSVTNSSISTEWYPYLGASEIDKETFYQITGQTELYNDYVNGMKKQNTMNACGWALLIATALGGTALAIYGIYDDYNTLFAYSGLGLVLVGGLVSLPLVSWQYNDNVSISFAVGLSDIYNNKLYESLK